MAQVTRQLVTFDWTNAVQSTDPRKLQPGQLVELVNVRRTEDGPGPLRKRLGLDKTSISTFQNRGSGVTYTGPATTLEDGGGSVIWRDTAEQLWTYNPDNGEGSYLGTDPRCFWRPFYLENLAPRGRTHKPVAVQRSGDIWYFAINNIVQAGTRYFGYQLTIVDATTKIVKRSSSVSIGADSIDGLCAAVDGSGNVWMFWFDHTATGAIYAHKYTSITGSATKTTFATVASVAISMIDCWKNTTTGDIDVVAIGTTSGSPNVITNYHAILDTTTGQAKASPAAVTQTQNGSTNASVVACASGLVIAEHDGSDGSFYYCFFREKSAATDNIELVRVKVTQSTLAVSSKTVVKDYSLSTSGTLSLATSAAYIDGSTEHYFTSHVETVPASWNTENPEPLIQTEHHTYNGSASTATFNLSTYVAGKPFRYNSLWYVLLGFDDGETTRAQRTYFVYRSDGYVLCPILQGSGAAIFHGGGLVHSFNTTTNPYLYRAESPHVVTPLDIGSGKFVYPLLDEGLGVASPDPLLAEISFSETYYSQAPGISVGGIPKFIGPKDRVGELAPILAPYGSLSFTASSGASVATTNRMTYRFLTRTADGKLHRSPAATIQTVSFTGATNYVLNIPNVRHTNGTSWVEVYSSLDGATDLFLQLTTFANVFADTTAVLVQPQSFSSAGESLDTVGGALPPVAPEPCRLAIVHKNRTWLGGTSSGEIWPSQEHRQGRGPEFNPALNFEWTRGAGELRGWSSVDDDALALFKQDAIALVTGPGPDGLGQGSFDVRTLPGKDGCSNPFAIIQGPLGVYFPRHSDGRMCLLTLGGVQEIHQGMEDYVSYTWMGSVDDKAKREIRWYASNGKILRLDYGHPTPDQPWGQWILDENSNLPAWIGARLINGDPVALEAGTTSIARTWKPGSTFADDGVSFGVRFTTGWMSPAGPQQEFDTDQVWVSSTELESGCTYEYRVTDSLGTEVHTDVTTSQSDVYFRTARQRQREVKLQVIETQANGSQGRQFDGVVMEFCLYNRPQSPRRRIA